MDKRKEANLRVKRNIVRALTELMQKKIIPISLSPKSLLWPVYPVFLIIGTMTAKKISLLKVWSH